MTEQNNKTEQDTMSYSIKSVKGLSLIDNAIMESDQINDSMFRTYCVLVQMANNKWDVAFPSMATLGKYCGHSDRTARRNVQELEKLDLVKRIERPGHSNHFQIKLFHESSVLFTDEMRIEKIKQLQEKSKQKGSSQGSGNDPKREDTNKEFYKSIIAYFIEKTGKKSANGGHEFQVCENGV